MGLEREHKVPIPTRPHSTHIQGFTVSSAHGTSDHHHHHHHSHHPQLQDVGKGVSAGGPEGLPPLATSPLKVSHLDPPIETSTSPVVPPDGGAPPSLPEPPRETANPEAKEPPLTSAVPIIGGEKEARGQKSSEPPPSLQALFSRDMGSSRRWADSLSNVHLKQHSFDSSHLQSIGTQYPKLLSRVKSPSMLLDKNTRLDTSAGMVKSEGFRRSEGIHRTPSHPHLSSPVTSPQVPRSMAIPLPHQQQQQQQQQAQLFWTGASLLESDYPGEYSMALRLLSKVLGYY